MAQLTNIPGLQEALDAIAAGSRDGRPVDGDGVRGTYLDLPFDREFRVEITEATYKLSQAGNEGIRYVLTIQEDGTDNPYVGQKVWGGVYFTGHPMQGQTLGTLLASAGRSAPTVEAAADVIVGGKLVIALKEGNDPRYPEPRWLNLDKGQKLNLKVKPKAGTSTANLTATLPTASATQAAAPVAAPAPVVQAPAPVVAAPAAQPPSGVSAGPVIKLPGVS